MKLNNLTADNLLKSELNLNKSEFLVFKTIMLHNDNITMKELVNKIGKDRTTIQRTLNNLLSKRLIEYKQINLHKGFMYVYFIDKYNKMILIDKLTDDLFDIYKQIGADIKKW